MNTSASSVGSSRDIEYLENFTVTNSQTKTNIDLSHDVSQTFENNKQNFIIIQEKRDLQPNEDPNLGSGTVSKATDKTKMLDKNESIFYLSKLEEMQRSIDVKHIKIKSKAFSPSKGSPFRLSTENEKNLNKTITNITEKLKKN